MLTNKRIVGVALPVAAGLLATAALLLGLGARPAAAAGTPRFVSPAGDDQAGANDCTSSGAPCLTVQQALNAAGVGDTIQVAEGTYTSAGGTVATITQTVTLQGGWNSAFSQNNPATHPTVLDGQSLAPVVVITPSAPAVGGPIAPTVEGLVIAHGRGVAAGCPAGVVSSPLECGGGIRSMFADPLILNNVITNNIGGSNPQEGNGGGIFLYGAGAGAVISGNLIISNVANLTGRGLGGGIMENISAATIQGNQIWQNRDSLVPGSQGAGLMLAASPSHVIGNDIRANASTSRGGGLWVAQLNAGTVVISGNTFFSNTAVTQGGALLINGNAAVIVADNAFGYNQATSPTAGRGGALRVSSDSFGVTISHNDFYANVAAAGGGSAIDLGARGLVDGNTLHQNQNSGPWGAALVLSGTAPLTATNNVVVDNQGGGIQANSLGTSVSIVNNTVAGNHNASGGAPGDGLLIAWDTAPAGTVTATVVNNLLVNGASCGLDVKTPGTGTLVVVSHHNDVSGNAPNYCDAAGSAGNFSANPLFVNAAAGDYHLSAGSPAINTGSGAEAPATDRDGVSRPQGAAVDIGAFEYVQPIGGLSAASSSPTEFGQATALTASLSAGTGVSYRWSLGNGATASGASTIYTYPAVGFYTALVTATNFLGSVTATTPVTVDDRPLAGAGFSYSISASVPLRVAALGLLANASDTFPGGLTAQLAAGPAVGTLVVAPNGAFTYTPPLAFGGVVTFRFQANDGVLLSAAAPVTITVHAFELYLPLVRH